MTCIPEMLKSLLVKNYALITDAEIHFEAGLNILTGETGAGKSIVIGALGSILGERVDTSVVRDGAAKAVIEAIFDVKECADLCAFLTSRNVEGWENELVLRREISVTGRSRAFINDSPVQVGVLQQVGDLLVDLHGQHEHQSLLKISYHLRFLDEFGALEKEVSAVSAAHRQLTQLLRELGHLQDKEKAMLEKKDFYAFQLAEIDKLNPGVEEEETLLKDEKIIRNSEKLFNLTTGLYKLLYENEQSVFDGLSQALGLVGELVVIDEKFKTLKNDCVGAQLTVDELAKAVQTYSSGIEFNADNLEIIQSRLAELNGLRKKYNRSIQEILEYRDQIKAELAKIESQDADLAAISVQIDSQKKQFSRLCHDLSSKRLKVACKLEAIIPDVMALLGMPGAGFKVALAYQEEEGGLAEVAGTSYRSNGNGMDFAEFLISTNAGEEVRPLRKVASGGEISRIMLALKSIIARKGRIPVLIFDEIDSGVSGRIASAVGRKLLDLAGLHQVICITHLPQIASMGEHHYLVEKHEHEGRTESTIRKLSHDERAEAIALLLAGESVSEAHLNSARELLKDAVLN